MDLKFTVEGQDVTAALDNLIAAGLDLGPAMDRIGRVLRTRVRLLFREGKGPHGEAWPAPKFRSGQPLVDTGRLRDSIEYRAEGSVGKGEVEIGTNVCYAHIHQFGATIKASKIPHMNGCGMTKGAGFLRWVSGGSEGGASGSGYVYAQSVTIPPRPFLPTSGLPDDWQQDVAAELADYLAANATPAGVP